VRDKRKEHLTGLHENDIEQVQSIEPQQIDQWLKEET